MKWTRSQRLPLASVNLEGSRDVSNKHPFMKEGWWLMAMLIWKQWSVQVSIFWHITNVFNYRYRRLYFTFEVGKRDIRKFQLWIPHFLLFNLNLWLCLDNIVWSVSFRISGGVWAASYCFRNHSAFAWISLPHPRGALYTSPVGSSAGYQHCHSIASLKWTFLL